MAHALLRAAPPLVATWVCQLPVLDNSWHDEFGVLEQTRTWKYLPTMGLLIAAVWLSAGGLGVYTYFKYLGYVNGLPASEGNETLKRKFTRRLLWSLICVAIGAWRALAHWFPVLNVRSE